jgi:formate dehydrogenase accessory protein FdhE
MTFASMGVVGVNAPWDRRVRRAEALAGADGPVAPLLAFYVRLLRTQKSLYESFTRRPPSGGIERDAARVAGGAGALLQEVAKSGPDRLAAEARTLLQDGVTVIERLLLAQWQASSDRQFFAKALLQPYGQWLADTMPPSSQPSSAHDNCCPRCGGAPQLSILSAAGASGDGSSRQLQCARCLTLWFFRRVMCPSCGEEDERKLGYFHSPAFDHVRVDACDSCRRYLKSIDLGRLGLAVPLVDEVAAAPLDAWACDHGYEKIELNLLGL